MRPWRLPDPPAARRRPAPQAKLSERNVVELVNKLKQLGLLGDELLHTTNGREYITREQVKVEVAEAVAEAGGRVPLVSAVQSGAELYRAAPLQPPGAAARCAGASGGETVAGRRAPLPARPSLLHTRALAPHTSAGSSKHQQLCSPQVDLPPLLGVDLVHCERAAEQLIQEGGSGCAAPCCAAALLPVPFLGLAAELSLVRDNATGAAQCQALWATSRSLLPRRPQPPPPPTHAPHAVPSARAAARRPAAGVFQAQGELFTPLYFDGLAAEVDEGLQEAGVVALGQWV